MRVSVFDHQDRYVKSIGPSELLVFAHRDELNGEDSLSISTTSELRQGYRLVWRDRSGEFHEHVCQDPQALRDYGAPIYTDTALNSICETLYDRIEDKRPYSQTYAIALQSALEPTRWAVGTCDQPGTVSSGLRFYRESSREAINAILQCGGELETKIECSKGRVVGRSVGIRSHRGRSSGHRRFSYRKDLISMSKTEHWGAITACYGYGKSLETEEGGYSPKLTFGSINGGLDYVADGDALEAWGRADGKGGLAHVFGTYENGECDDPQQLYDETSEYLEAHKVPGMSYEASVVDLVAMGREWEGVGVGDDVQIVDSEFTPTLRCSGRVTCLETDYVSETQVVTLGNVVETMADVIQGQQSQIDGLLNGAGGWNAAASVTTAYLEQFIARLNERFNVMGASYTFTSFETGTIWASVPMDESGRPTKAGGFAIQICSQGFRIASGTLPDGSFDWRTFGTGEGFTADLITAGTINAALVKAGILSDNQGKNFWNMSTGEFRLSMETAIGGGSNTVGKTVFDVDVQYGLSDSATSYPSTWTTTALWQQGKHMWSRQKRVLADGTIEFSTPRRIANASGLGGVSTTEQYYLSTSEAEPVGGQWLNSQPAWVSGRYYWTRNRTQWSDGTVTYDEPVLARALTDANQAVNDLDSSLDAEGVFNRLTDNGAIQGLYQYAGNLYMNASFIKSGTLDANLIRAGVIQDVAGKNKWDLVSGNMALSGNITMSGGRIQGANGSYWDLDTGEMDLSFTPAGMLTQEDLDAAISDVEVDMGGLSSRITTAQTTANSARSAASTAQSTANTAKSTADSANTKATSAKAKTDRISFTTSGIQVTGTDGVRRTAMTYGSDGIVHAGSVLEIETDNASLGVKDWGIAYQGPGGENSTVQFYVSNNRDEIYARTSNTSIAIRTDGAYVNGRKLAWA